MPDPTTQETERLKYLIEVYKLYHGHINTMFNYYLVLVGLIVTGYVAALPKDGKPGPTQVAAAIAIFGALVSIIALKIHRRSRQFLDTIETALMKSEETLFPNGEGFLLVLPNPASPLARHRGQFPAIYWLAFFGLLVAAIHAEADNLPALWAWLQSLGRGAVH